MAARKKKDESKKPADKKKGKPKTPNMNRSDDYERHVSGSDKAANKGGPKANVPRNKSLTTNRQPRVEKEVKGETIREKPKSLSSPTKPGWKEKAKGLLKKGVGGLKRAAKGSAPLLIAQGVGMGGAALLNSGAFDKPYDPNDNRIPPGKDYRKNKASNSKTKEESLKNKDSKKPTPVKSVKTKGGDYPVYKKSSSEAGEFRAAFASARKSGKKEFTWQGRKYNTKVK